MVVVRSGGGGLQDGSLWGGIARRGWFLEKSSENQKSLAILVPSPSSKVDPKRVLLRPSTPRTRLRSHYSLQDRKGRRGEAEREFSELCWSGGVEDRKNQSNVGKKDGTTRERERDNVHSAFSPLSWKMDDFRERLSRRPSSL